MKEKVPKYLIIGEAFYPEEFLINDLVKEWEKTGYQLEVLTRAPSYPFGKVFPGYKNKLYQKEKWGDIIIHRFPVMPGYNKSTFIKILNYLSFVIYGSIIALFIAKRYKQVFIYHTGPLSLAIPGILIKKISRVPVTIWSFDLWPATVYAYGFKKTKLLSWFLDSLVKWIYKNCENIIVSSQGFVPELKKYVFDKPIYIAPNWPQTANILSHKSSIILQPGKLHFTFTGNVGKVQNLENVIIGFRNAAIPYAQLNIIGDGSNLEFLKKMVADEKIKYVLFHGRVPVAEISDILDQSDVLLISLMPDPVMEMTLPLKFQTYLNASKPIYAVMLGEVNRIVREYQIGEVANPQNIDEITNGFKKYGISQERKEEIKKQCEFLINSVYNRKKIIQDITGIFFKSSA
jgi:glycosyltransferase involved in cell wall biosynthesis